jgi:hypothetical protein
LQSRQENEKGDIMSGKLKVTFPTNISQLLGKSRFIYTCLTGNPHFPNLSPEVLALLATLSETIATLQTADNELWGRYPEKKPLRDKLVKDLNNVLKKIARHVELDADGNVDILRSSGFDVLESGASKSRKTIFDDLPPIVTFEHLPNGILIARTKPIPSLMGIEVHLAQGDPTVAENWNHYQVFPRPSKMEMAFTSGQSVSLRFRYLQPKGPGPWSPTHTVFPI